MIGTHDGCTRGAGEDSARDPSWDITVHIIGGSLDTAALSIVHHTLDISFVPGLVQLQYSFRFQGCANTQTAVALIVIWKEICGIQQQLTVWDFSPIFGDKLLEDRVVCPQNGTAVLKGSSSGCLLMILIVNLPINSSTAVRSFLRTKGYIVRDSATAVEFFQAAAVRAGRINLRVSIQAGRINLQYALVPS